MSTGPSTAFGMEPNEQTLQEVAGRQAVGVAQENPFGLAIGAVAAGFLAGMLIPSTRVEDERLGPLAESAKEPAQQTAQEALEPGDHLPRA